jgi:hypothetical protein
MRYPLGIGEGGGYHTEPPSEMLTAVKGSSLAPPRELEIDPMGVKGITRKERQLHSAHGSAVWRTFLARTFLAT